jgi:hypothetical protein
LAINSSTNKNLPQPQRFRDLKQISICVPIFTILRVFFRIGNPGTTPSGQSVAGIARNLLAKNPLTSPAADPKTKLESSVSRAGTVGRPPPAPF